ncbi:hypothetical protein QQZ08_006895 [Neonectria magnoliae]|uniref:Aspartate transaminase n=1 Tax=Neonectria magnoliae TaxID=2732573 RepID=A0ABR1HZ58_9HYPO
MQRLKIGNRNSVRHLSTLFFNNVTKGAPDVMYHLKVQADGDTSPEKVDLGVGIYRNEQGVYNEMKVLKDVTTGNPSYLNNAAKLVFGKDSALLQEGGVASAQPISGTGAVHITFMLMSRSVPGMSKTVYVGTPALGKLRADARSRRPRGGHLLGLYGERVGAVHALCPTTDVAGAVHDQLRLLIRSEFSSSPAYGARMVDLLLPDHAREIV